MSAERFYLRYLLWNVVPPFFTFLPLAMLFFFQTIGLVAEELARTVVVGFFFYGGMAVILITAVGAAARRVENVSPGVDASDAISECQRITIARTIQTWFVGGAGYAITTSLVAIGTASAIPHLLITVMIAGTPSLVWTYAVSKHMLRERAAPTGARFTGTPYTLARKYAVVFVGVFVVASIAVIDLVTSHVSKELERLATAEISDQFESVHSRLEALPSYSREKFREISKALPDDCSLYRIAVDGTVMGVLPENDHDLTDRDLTRIRAKRTGDSSSYFGPSIALFREMSDGAILVATVSWNRFGNILSKLTLFVGITTGITLIVFAGITWSLSRDIQIPLTKVHDVANDMAEGDFRRPVSVYSDDDIGVLAYRFEQTRQRLAGLVNRVDTSGRAIMSGVGVIRRGTESLRSRATEQGNLLAQSSESLDTVKTGIERISESAASVKRTSRETSDAAHELHASAESVALQMEELAGSVDKIGSSIVEMDAAAKSAEGQGRQLRGVGETVFALIRTLESEISDLRAIAQRTAEIADQVRDLAADGTSDVDRTRVGIELAESKTVSAARVLKQLTDQVGRVGLMVDVITDVTEKTDLLSLNASIIAARAGDQGAGFAVVASEIRDLAHRTRKSTTEIKEIVESVQSFSAEAVEAIREGVGQVTENTSLVQSASKSLEKILEAARESSETARQISTAVVEQTAAVGKLEDASLTLEGAVSEISRSLIEQSGGTSLLTQEAETVRSIATHVTGSASSQLESIANINAAMNRVMADMEHLDELVHQQLQESESIATASQLMISIAGANDTMAVEFEDTIRSLSSNIRRFESEVENFRLL